MRRSLFAAQVAYAHWLFGNVYEAVVRVPDRIARQPLPSLLSAGSPLRYYLPGVPVIIVGTVAAVANGWKDPRKRPLLVAMAASVSSGVAITAFLVPAVNLKVFVQSEKTDRDEQDRLIALWYRANVARIVCASVALLAAARLADEP